MYDAPLPLQLARLCAPLQRTAYDAGRRIAVRNRTTSLDFPMLALSTSTLTRPEFRAYLALGAATFHRFWLDGQITQSDYQAGR